MRIKPLDRPTINKLTLYAYGQGVAADNAGKHDKFLTRSEVDSFGDKDFKRFYGCALAAAGNPGGLTTGDLYAYAKKVVVELRNVADTKGNKNGGLETAELKYLSPAGKALAKLGDALAPKPRH